MQNLNKKGLSEIVQTVMIVALSIMAIATVSKYVLSLTSELDNQLSPAVDCLSTKSRITSYCLNSNNQIELNINSFDKENPSLKISTGKEVFICNNNLCSTCKLSEGTSKIYINLQNPATEISYQFDSCQLQTLSLKACATP
jgi:hypothetical protein